MMKKIDIHAHAFPSAYVQSLGKNIDGNQPIKSNWVWDENRFLGEMDR
jgi:hypothetical protein